ncbi:hydroxylysine kinase-like [Diadema antillarum]|uniref:hydroxylysine kinase-like n=1 Tax=Diadema antillarum TaxID=105358 RepID=UPI003A8C0387
MAVRPNLSFEQGVHLTQKLYGLEDVVCLQEFISYDNQNLLIEARCPQNNDALNHHHQPREKFVLKLTNSEDSKLFILHKQINEVLLTLREAGIPCSFPLTNVEGKHITLEELSFKHKDTGKEETGMFLTRLMNYLPGQFIGSTSLLTGKMCYEAGQLLGEISSTLQKYDGDPNEFALRAGEYDWCLKNLPRIEEYVHVIQDDTHKELVREVVQAFREKVLSQEDKLPKGLIHGDFNDYNILVKEEKSLSSHQCSDAKDKDVVGILDFDDMMYSSTVYDVAIAMMYIMQCSNLECKPLESSGLLLAGFLSKQCLSEEEYGVIYYCVAGRLVQSLVLGLYTFSQQPQNDYLLSTQVKGWEAVSLLWSHDAHEVNLLWRKIAQECRF